MSAEHPDLAVARTPPHIFHVAVVNPVFEFANKLYVIVSLKTKIGWIIVKPNGPMIFNCLQSSMRRADIKRDLGWVHLQGKVYIHRVKRIQNGDKPFSKVIISLLQKYLTGWRKCITSVPNAGPAKSVYHGREVDVFVRL